MPDTDPAPRSRQLEQLQKEKQRSLEQQITETEARQDWLNLEPLCRQALQSNPDDWSLWQRLGNSLEQRREWSQAETLWRHLTQRFANRPDPFLALASLQRRQGSPAGARIVLEQARQQLGEQPELVRSQAFLDDPWLIDRHGPRLTRQSPAGEVAATLQAAQEHLDAGRAAEAEAAFQQLTEARPESLPFHRSLAVLRRRRGCHALLVNQLMPLFTSPVDRQRPLPLDLTHALVEALLNLERWEALELLLAQLLPNLPEDAILACAQARLLLERNQPDQAISLLRQAVAHHPDHAGALAVLGEALVRIGDQPAAISAYEQALAVDPHRNGVAKVLEETRRSLLWTQGEEALRQAQWSQAAQAFRHLRDRDPADSRAAERLEFLASLQPRQWAGLSSADQDSLEWGEGPRSHRLAEFASVLDRIEARIKAQIERLP